MKTNAKSAKVVRVIQVSAVERQVRMSTYLTRTRAAFESSVVKSLGLGKAANGVLAGPMTRI